MKAQWKMGTKNVFRCQPDVVGGVVEIIMYGSRVKLELCEVQVKGIPGKNLVWLREHYCYYEFSRHIVTYCKTSINKLHTILYYIWHYSTHYCVISFALVTKDCNFHSQLNGRITWRMADIRNMVSSRQIRLWTETWRKDRVQ